MKACTHTHYKLTHNCSYFLSLSYKVISICQLKSPHTSEMRDKKQVKACTFHVVMGTICQGLQAEEGFAELFFPEKTFLLLLEQSMRTYKTISCALNSHSTSTWTNFLFQPRFKAGVWKQVSSAAIQFGQHEDNKIHFMLWARMWPYKSRHLGQCYRNVETSHPFFK